MAITPIGTGISPLGLPPAGPSVSKPAEGGEGFTNLVKEAVGKVDKDQQRANVAIQDLIAGRSSDVLPVVNAVANADMSFKLLVGVRNKVIEAYKQTMNMQI